MEAIPLRVLNGSVVFPSCRYRLIGEESCAARIRSSKAFRSIVRAGCCCVMLLAEKRLSKAEISAMTRQRWHSCWAISKRPGHGQSFEEGLMEEAAVNDLEYEHTNHHFLSWYLTWLPRASVGIYRITDGGVKGRGISRYWARINWRGRQRRGKMGTRL